MQNVWDGCTLSHNSIAAALYQALGSRFRYVGKGVWEHRDADKWCIDKKHTQLIQAILRVTGHILERAIFWSENPGEDVQRPQRLIEIALKLKSQTSRDAVIHEAREYFVDV